MLMVRLWISSFCSSMEPSVCTCNCIHGYCCYYHSPCQKQSLVGSNGFTTVCSKGREQAAESVMRWIYSVFTTGPFFYLFFYQMFCNYHTCTIVCPSGRRAIDQYSSRKTNVRWFHHSVNLLLYLSLHHTSSVT